MLPASRGFSRLTPPPNGQNTVNTVGERFPVNRTLMEVIKGLEGASTEMVERSKTIFFLSESTLSKITLYAAYLNSNYTECR